MEPNQILRFLPENYRFAAGDARGPMAALLGVMDELQAPDETIIEHFDDYISPYRAPDDFVMLQASWLGLDRYFDWSGGRPGAGRPVYRAGVSQLRLLVAEAAELLRQRGRTATLLRFLVVATGVRGFRIAEEPEEGQRPFHFTLEAPFEARPLERLVVRIVDGERPAHATYTIEFAAAASP